LFVEVPAEAAGKSFDTENRVPQAICFNTGFFGEGLPLKGRRSGKWGGNIFPYVRVGAGPGQIGDRSSEPRHE
jgi:hypothetical protein